MQGAWRFTKRLWRLIGEATEIAASAPADRPASFGEPALVVRKAAHGALAKVSDAIEKLHFNVCVAHIYEFANALGAAHRRQARQPTPDFAWAMREAADILVRLFHPMMPHLAEECWAALGHNTLVASEAWPKRRGRRSWSRTPSPCRFRSTARSGPMSRCARDAKNADIEAAVLALDAVQRALDGKRPKKVIVVPQRIVNVVA